MNRAVLPPSMAGATTLERVRNEVLQAVEGRGIKVFLFGSWARGDAVRTSDIDVALDPPPSFPRAKISRLRERLEELPVAYPVQVVDLRDTGDAFRKRIQKEAIAWHTPL